jgi:hypothetical protein|tara:strand:- start:1723 stop:2496 length:774 start_codon:yes stop_codon:yes gene_type:complete
MVEDIFKVEEAEVTLTKDGRVRKRRPKKSIDYFTLDTQQAILDYRLETSQAKRNQIFNEKIYYAFFKLAENIIHTFKFYYTEVDNINELKHEVIAFLLEKLHLYDPSKGKAYSYFGTIAKRYLIVYNNNNYKRLKGKAPVEDVDSDKTLTNELLLTQPNPLEELNFIDLFIKKVDDDLLDLFPKAQEARVGDAILELFKRRENIDIFNKKALFIYIKEITDAPTPIITKVIKVLKEIYKEMLNHYLEEGTEINIFSK